MDNSDKGTVSVLKVPRAEKYSKCKITTILWTLRAS